MSGVSVVLTKTFTAGAAITKRRLVKIGSADGQVIQAAGTTAAIIGVAAELDVDSGDRVDVHVVGIAEVEAGGTITRGALVTSDVNGKAVAAAPGAGVNAYVAGIALNSAVSGDIIPVQLAPGVMQGA